MYRVCGGTCGGGCYTFDRSCSVIGGLLPSPRVESREGDCGHSDLSLFESLAEGDDNESRFLNKMLEEMNKLSIPQLEEMLSPGGILSSGGGH